MGEFLILVCGDIFVDERYLSKGIYATETPRLYNVGVTLEFLEKQEAKVKAIRGVDETAQYIENLRQCTLKRVSLNLMKGLNVKNAKPFKPSNVDIDTDYTEL